MDFGRQVGKENRPKSHQKWHRKKNEKMRGNFRKTAPQGLPKSGPPPGACAPVPPQTPPYLSLRKPMQLQSASGMLSVIHEKSMPRCLPKLSSFFDRFWIDLGNQLRPPDPSKSRFFHRKNEVFSKNCLLKITSILNPFWRPTCLQNQSK